MKRMMRRTMVMRTSRSKSKTSDGFEKASKRRKPSKRNRRSRRRKIP